jgi:hypothetical protein
MITGLRYDGPPYEVLFIPNLTSEAIASIATSYRLPCSDGKIVAKEVWESRGKKKALQNELGAIFFWVLTKGLDVDSGLAIDILEDIAHREELGTTGVGRGLAIPHTSANVDYIALSLINCTDTAFQFDSVLRRLSRQHLRLDSEEARSPR